LITNIAGTLGKATKEIQDLQISHFKKADIEYGTEIEKQLQMFKRSAHQFISADGFKYFI